MSPKHLVRMLLATLAAVLLASPAAAGAADKTKWLCKPGTKADPCVVDLTTTVAEGGRQLDRRERAQREEPEDRLLLRLPDGQRPEDDQRDPADRPGGDGGRDIPGGALLADVPGVGAGVPPGHARGHRGSQEIHARSADQRLQEHASGVARVPGEAQQGPRVRADRPFAGLVPAPQAGRGGDRQAARREAPARVRGAARAAT